MNFTSKLIEIVSDFPTSINTKEAEEVGLYILPFSVGIEFECGMQETYNKKDFEAIPYIVDIDVDEYEQRYRIPKGLKGLQCLYHLSTALYKNSVINEGSGIHYHVDFTDCYSRITDDFIRKEEDYILRELQKWNYKGTYNRKQVKRNQRGWVQVSDEFKTFEFRIGEMTFDYNLLFKRISHLIKICKQVKHDNNLYFLNIDNSLEQKNTKKDKDIIKNRKINLYEL